MRISLYYPAFSSVITPGIEILCVLPSTKEPFAVRKSRQLWIRVRKRL